MATAADIRAGRAFVELFLKDHMLKALQKSLKSAGKSVTDFGEGVTKLGVGISAVGAGMLAPIAAGVKAFMDMGGAAVDAAARTGLSVEALSELGFAAAQTGTDMGTVEAAIKRLAKSDLAKVGESAEQTFMRVAGEIAAIEDPMKRAAAAQKAFGRSGVDLLPMLADMEALRAKARELGIVMSSEDAAAADDLGDAWDALKAQGKAIFFQIGKAVAGPLKEFADRASVIAKRVIDWAEANGPLIATWAKLAVGVTLAGAAITALGGITTAAGMALTGLATVIGTVSAVIGAVLSPVGLLAIGIGTAIVKFTNLRDLLRPFAELLRSLGDDFSTTWTGIANAIKSGDLDTAIATAMAGLRLTIVRTMTAVGASITGLWGDALDDIAARIALGDMQGAWKTAVDGMGAVWSEFIETAKEAWNDFATDVEAVIARIEKAMEVLAEYLDRARQAVTPGPLKDVSTQIRERLRRPLYDTGAGSRAAPEQDMRGLGPRLTPERIARAEEIRRRAHAGQPVAIPGAEETAEMKAFRERIEASAGHSEEIIKILEAELKAITSRVTEATTAVETEAKKHMIGRGEGGGAGSTAGGAAAAAAGVSVAGTFSAAALAALGRGGGDVPKKTLEEVKESRKTAGKSLDTLGKMLNELKAIEKKVAAVPTFG